MDSARRSSDRQAGKAVRNSIRRTASRIDLTVCLLTGQRIKQIMGHSESLIRVCLAADPELVRIFTESQPGAIIADNTMMERVD